MKTISKVLATFFGVGFFPVAPGTLTSAIVVILYKFFLYDLSWPLYLLIFLFLFFIGVFASSNYASALNKKDPGNITIDEAAGQLFVLFRIPNSWIFLIAGFLLFRLFDIVKPYPIKKFEHLEKGWGIMIDDIIAAIYAAFILNIYLLLK